MVANWNSTIRAASGKYIKFLFQDDLLHANCLEEIVKLAESDERIGLVFSQRKLLIEPSAEGDAFTTWLLRYQDLSAALGELKTSQPGPSLLRSQHLLHEPLNKIGEPTAVLIRTDLFVRSECLMKKCVSWSTWRCGCALWRFLMLDTFRSP